jgi:hypothetical protein
MVRPRLPFKSLWLVVVLLNGCAVQYGIQYDEVEDFNENTYVELSLVFDYPKRQMISRDEYVEMQGMSDSQREKMYEYYKERQELEDRWTEFFEELINKIL